MDKLKKIVMIGPVYPYKTGLSYYTGLMYQSLAEKYDVSMISYKMQYPKLLFKGEQRDYNDDAVKIENVEYMINTANPINCISSARKINQLHPDLVIFQWLHPYFAPCFYIMSKCLKNTKILFVCHNVFPHERFPMDRLLTKIALGQGDFFITHAKSDENDLKGMLKNANCKVNVHPAYNFFKIKKLTKSEARSILGLGEAEKVLLFFGLIREYKGLKHLINALPMIQNSLGKVRLLIAGDFKENKEDYIQLIQQNNVSNSINIYDGHIPIPEVEKFFAACDMVVLPYESATQSGVIQVAYSFGKSVLATNVGGLPDVVIDGETGYVVEPCNPEAIANAVIDCYENDRFEHFSSGVKREAYKYSWDKMRNTIESFWN